MLMRYANSNKQGDAGVGAAIGYFTSHGYTVCVPLTDSQNYDLVVDIDGLKKVQVRTSTRTARSGAIIVELRVRGGNNSTIKYVTESGCDYLFIYIGTGSYLIPMKEVKSRSGLTLNRYEKFKVYQKWLPL